MRETVTSIWEDIVASATLLRAAILGEEGQTLAEYSLIITVIAVGVVAPTMFLMRGALGGAFDSVTDCISRVTC